MFVVLRTMFVRAEQAIYLNGLLYLHFLQEKGT